MMLACPRAEIWKTRAIDPLTAAVTLEQPAQPDSILSLTMSAGSGCPSETWRGAADGSSKEISMGSWDVDSFGNDTACDWGYSLEEQSHLALVEETLRRAADAGGYLEAPEAEEAVAAAEVIARLQARPGVKNSYTETVDKWVEAHPILPTEEQVQLALRALDRVSSSESELLELWQDSDEFARWQESLRDLRLRVRGR